MIKEFMFVHIKELYLETIHLKIDASRKRKASGQIAFIIKEHVDQKIADLKKKQMIYAVEKRKLLNTSHYFGPILSLKIIEQPLENILTLSKKEFFDETLIHSLLNEVLKWFLISESKSTDYLKPLDRE